MEFRAISAFVPHVPLPVRATRHPWIASRRPTVFASHSLNGRELPGPLKPVGQNILVKVGEISSLTTGGIILPDEAKEKPTFGEVVEVGLGKYYGNGVKIPMNVEKGDTVLYGQYGGTDVNYDGEKHTIVTQDDVLCKFSAGAQSLESCVPIFDRVLVKVHEAVEESVSGIILSGTTKEKPTSGTVVCMGDGRFMENGEFEPPAFKLADDIYYGQYAGTPVQLEGEEYVLLRVADVYAKA